MLFLILCISLTVILIYYHWHYNSWSLGLLQKFPPFLLRLLPGFITISFYCVSFHPYNNPLPGGLGFDFGVYSPREVGFTMPKHSPPTLHCGLLLRLAPALNLSGLGGPTSNLRSSQHSSPGRKRARKAPHDDKLAVLEEINLLLTQICS